MLRKIGITEINYKNKIIIMYYLVKHDLLPFFKCQMEPVQEVDTPT